jgi:mono/diheme cytochrome c family protein
MRMTMRAPTALAVALGLASAASIWTAPQAASPAQVQGRTAAGPTGSAAPPRATLDTYCVSCHNQRLKTGGLALDTLDLSRVPADAGAWEKVIRKVRTGAMPPAGMPRPDAATRDGLVAWLETTIDRAAAPFPGHPSIHRLNRAEYANAVHDLVALDVDVAALLPPDEPAYGFDNIGEMLDVSPALLERYSGAAAEIATLAVGDVSDVVPGARVFRSAADHSQDQHNDGLPLGTSGGMAVKTTLPLDGEYVIKVGLFKTNLGMIRGLEFRRQLEIVVDGRRVLAEPIGGAEEYEGMLQNQTAVADAVEARLQVRVPLTAGPHDIGATFAARPEVENTRRLQAVLRSTSDTSETLIGPPLVLTVTVTGPFNPTGPGDTPSRRAIFTCRPASAAQEEGCARTILSRLARRAYRGMQTPADVDELMGLFREWRRDASFDSAIGFALQRILAGPKFLVRTERVPASRPGTVYRVTDGELASRLSFFLWSSLPDDELLQLASQGRLSRPATLEQQVRRMLADPRASALAENFAGQWLQLRNLRSAVPDSREFPNFDDQLRQAFRRETELLFDSILREDRSVLDLLTADYTFVNERLAKHYGIPHIYGNHFRRVPVTVDARRGILGHGSILTVTSHADRTSPVVRGKWILDNLLGTPPPPPPPIVPALPERSALARPMTMRERMEQHRANPQCASCHKAMDPLGFALENFDAVGAWRIRDGRAPIDASGAFVDGSSIDGPAALRQALLAKPAILVGNLTEKLLIYGLGRGIDYRDMPAVRAIVRDAGNNGYRFSTLVLGIVRSDAFQKRIVAANTQTD